MRREEGFGHRNGPGTMPQSDRARSITKIPMPGRQPGRVSNLAAGELALLGADAPLFAAEAAQRCEADDDGPGSSTVWA